MGDSLSVSIIIPCRDDYKHLLITLIKISKLYPKPDVIVCDASKKPSIIKEIYNTPQQHITRFREQREERDKVFHESQDQSAALIKEKLADFEEEGEVNK